MPRVFAPGDVVITVPTARLTLTAKRDSEEEVRRILQKREQANLNGTIFDVLRARARAKRWAFREGSLGALLEQIFRPPHEVAGAGPDVWKFYDDFHLRIADGTWDLDGGGAFTMALFQSTSNFATASTNVYGSLTNEVANGNGYTTGGAAMGSVTWTRATATAKFTAAGTVWTASGAGISTVRAAVIYMNATVNTVVKPLMCWSLLDNTPADVPTITSGNTLTITPNASGIFTLTG